MRLVAAFFIAPWVPVAAYYAYYAMLWSSRGGDSPPASAFFAGFAPVAYAATLVAWLPFVSILRRFGKLNFLPLAVGGTVLGAAVGIGGLAAGGGEIFAAETAHFLVVAAAVGLLFGVAFFAIGLAGRREGTGP